MAMVLNNPPAEMDGTTEQPLLQQVSYLLQLLACTTGTGYIKIGIFFVQGLCSTLSSAGVTGQTAFRHKVYPRTLH